MATKFGTMLTSGMRFRKKALKTSLTFCFYLSHNRNIWILWDFRSQKKLKHYLSK